MKPTTLDKLSFLDLTRQNEFLEVEILDAVKTVIVESAFSGGPFTERFENEFAAYCNTRFATGVNSGTSALHLALLALGVGAGDEVIVPANTFIATALGVTYTGATPVFADCHPETWNIDPSSVESKITARTKVIIGVHLYGEPCDIQGIQEICRKRKLYFIEDAAQAHGALYDGKKIGGFGDLACFSFYPGKNLGAYGEGGAVNTDIPEFAERIKSLRNYGSPKKYHHDEIGFNMRMDGIQGAVLSVKLKYLDKWNERRRQIAALYREQIHLPEIKMQHLQENAASVFHLFVITVPERDAFINHLHQFNIFPGMHYPVPCHLQKAYQHLGYKTGDFPNAEYLSAHCLSLPMFPEMTDDEVNRVVDAVNCFKA